MADEKDTDKPTVEVVRTGTDKEAAEAWEQAAFHHARRANKLRDAMIAARDSLNEALLSDAENIDK